jgi:hypothetical protein
VIDGRPIALVPLFTFEVRKLEANRKPGVKCTREPALEATRVENRSTGSVIVVDTLLPETQSRATLAAG